MGAQPPISHPARPPAIGWWSALPPFSIFVAGASLIPTTVSGTRLFIALEWVPGLGVELSLAIDGLSLLFVLIISLVGTAVFIFAGDYLGNHPRRQWFYVLLSTFMLSMLGVVSMDNLLALFVFWELTPLTSYLIIGFEHDRAEARFNARQALLVTGAGGLVMLVGILLLGHIAGTYSIANLVHQADVICSHRLYVPVLLLILAGALTKSAQFPFHFWLPNAMAAPTPISAFLHSATMVKAGIYLLARLHPVLGPTPIWMQTLVAIGGITALWGAILSIGQEDLKRMLAYATVMGLVIMTMFLGGQSTTTLTAAITFLMVHALYKSALFLIVGILDHQTGTRLLTHLGGLRRALPITTAATAAAALSMAGFPLFFGFIGKEIMYKGALTEAMFPQFATVAALVSNALMTAVAGILFLQVFNGPLQTPSLKPTEAGIAMWIGPLVLGFLGSIFGLFPDWVGRHLSVFYLMHHIIVKASLFLVGGMIRHSGGGFDLDGLGGLYVRQSLLAFLFFIPAFSLAGFPPFSGFWAKRILIRAGIEAGAVTAVTVAIIVGLLTAYSMTKIWDQAFWKPAPRQTEKQDLVLNAPSAWILAPVAMLVLLTVVIGLGTEPVYRLAFQSAEFLLQPDLYVQAVLGKGAS